MAKDFRLEAWFQPLCSADWDGEDDYEDRINTALRDLGLSCQGLVVFGVALPNGG